MMHRAELSRLLKSDPRAVLESTDRKVSLQDLESAIRTIGRMDFDEALELAKARSSPRQRSALLAALVPVWAGV